MKSINLFATFFLFPFVLDRFTKYWALINNCADMQINNFLSFDLSFNRGISWSIFYSENSVTFWVLTSIIFVIVAALAWYTYNRFRLGFPVYGELLILAGALSNLIDRFLYNGVIDFIVCDLGIIVWPTFNLADVFIIVGVLVMLAMGINDEKALS